MGSMMTAHVLSLTSWATDSQSLSLPALNPGTKGANGAWYLSCMVALRAPKDRP